MNSGTVCDEGSRSGVFCYAHPSCYAYADRYVFLYEALWCKTCLLFKSATKMKKKSQNLKLPDSEARRGAGKVSPRWVKLHTPPPGQRRARGHRCGLDRTAPFVTTAINIPLRNSTDVCPSGCFTADN